MLAVQTIALRKYYERNNEHSVLQDKNPIHGEFVVNLRRPDRVELGNVITTGIFAFPLHCKNPLDAIWKCKSQVDAMKMSPCFHVKKFIADLMIPYLPENILAKKDSRRGP